MAVTKGDLVKRVLEGVHLNKKKKSRQRFLFPEMDVVFLKRRQARALVNSLFEIIKDRLADGEDVLISGFGKFQVLFKWARPGRNPQTAERIVLRSRRTVRFRPSRKIRDKMNVSGSP
jgi:integration host factor subunit alpha